MSEIIENSDSIVLGGQMFAGLTHKQIVERIEKYRRVPDVSGRDIGAMPTKMFVEPIEIVDL